MSEDCGICSHRHVAHQAPNLGCEVRYVDGARCYCPGYRPRIIIGCRTCNGSGIAPDHSPMPDDEQPCPECVDADEYPRWVRSCRACGAAASTGSPRHYAMCAFTDDSAVR